MKVQLNNILMNQKYISEISSELQVEMNINLINFDYGWGGRLLLILRKIMDRTDRQSKAVRAKGVP